MFIKRIARKIINSNSIILTFIPMIILFNLIAEIFYTSPIDIKEKALGCLSGIIFLFMYIVYKNSIGKNNKILMSKTLEKNETILSEILINNIFGYIFIFICGLITSRTILLTINHSYNNLGHLNSSFAPFLLILLIILIPIPIFFFTNANIFITNKRISIIWNNIFMKQLFRIKNLNYIHNNIQAIEKTGLVLKENVIKYNNGDKYEINNIVVKNYKKIEYILEEIAKKHWR